MWLRNYWWVIFVILLIGVIYNSYKDMMHIDVKKFLKNRPQSPPHRDFNHKWDDDDWPDR